MGKTYFVPDYAIKFQCSMCGACCRRNWTVAIDKQTYETYKSIKENDEKFAMEINNNLTETKDGKAILKFKKAGEKLVRAQDNDVINAIEVYACPFLNDDGLCSIHKDKGIDLLGDTCKSYPRITTLTHRGIEIGLMYSCTTAAQLLKETNPVEFYHISEGFEFTDLHGYDGTTLSCANGGMNTKNEYFKVEEILIDIIQNRSMRFETRLSVIGLLVEKIRDKGEVFIKDYTEDTNAEFLNRINLIKPDAFFMMSLIENTMQEKFKSQLVFDDSMVELIVGLINGFGLLNKEIPLSQKVNTFYEGYNTYYKPYEANIDHIFENYFVNFIFLKKFFKYKYADAYFLAALFYIVIRFFTVYKCLAQCKNVDEEMLVGTISNTDLLIGHNEGFHAQAIECAKNNGDRKISRLISAINI